MSENTFPVETEELQTSQVPAEPAAEAEPAPLTTEETPEPLAQEPAEPIPAPQPEPERPAMPKVPLRKRVPLVVRMLLQVLSFVLCLGLIATVLGTVLVADLGTVISSDGIKKLITGFMSQSAPCVRPVHSVAPAMGRLARYNDIVIDDISDIPFVFDENGNIIGVTDPDGQVLELPSDIFFTEEKEGGYLAAVNPVTGQSIYVYPVFDEAGQVSGFTRQDGTVQEVDMELLGEYFPNVQLPDIELPPGVELPPDFQIPSDIQLPTDFTNTEALVDWAYNTVNQMFGGQMTISREDVKAFIQDSTITDFLADKVSGYTSDILNGTSDTIITAEDVMNLVKENQQLLRDKFNVEITQEQMQVIQDNVTAAIGDGEKLNATIQESIKNVVENQEPVVGDLNVQDILNLLAQITSRKMMTAMLAACAVLVLLLLALNFYNLPAGLGWAGFACMVSGGLLSLLVALVPDVLNMMPADMAGVAPVIESFAALFAPLHNTVLCVGVVLLVGSIVWRIVRNVLYNKRCTEAAVA